jgi:hypothetical protein
MVPHLLVENYFPEENLACRYMACKISFFLSVSQSDQRIQKPYFYEKRQTCKVSIHYFILVDYQRLFIPDDI